MMRLLVSVSGAVRRGQPSLALRWTLAGLCAAVVMAGCGKSEPERVRGVVGDYYEALSERDAERACELLGPHAHDGHAGECVANARERFAASEGDVDISELRAAAESGSVTIRGDRATVSRGADNDIAVIRVDGDWKIDRPRQRSSVRATPTSTPTFVPPWESAAQTTAQLAEIYPAFDRARTDDDARVLPAGFGDALRRRGYTLYPEQSRAVARLGRYQADVFPSTFRYTANVCAAISVDGDTAGVDCGAHTDFADQPHTSSVTVGTGTVVVAVFPAGVVSAKLKVRGGPQTRLRIRDGVAIVKLVGVPTTLTWSSERGQGTRNVE
jgi:hypothetical protein